ncbi:MAG TPA: sugar phosphate isomerase/epimerase [Gemmatimonadaceae bacterium]|nr:sugar phosphate isomerase/epimerase [Gemmatimonadaceae bacterium]
MGMMSGSNLCPRNHVKEITSSLVALSVARYVDNNHCGPMPDRREFLTTAALSVLGIKTALPTRLTVDGPIGLQLYTLRSEMKRSFSRTLERVRRAGYTEVEFAGYFGHSPRSIRGTLDANGLTAPAAHISLDDMATRWERTIADAATIGHRYLVCAWIDDEYRTADGYRRIADRFNRAADLARRSGIGFGYHNHTYEFKRIDNTTGYDILLAESDAENVAMELDVFWMRQAGLDALRYLTRFPGRYRMLHLKDMGPPPANAMVDVGKGVIDWRPLLTVARQQRIAHLFVEHDEPKDGFASIRSSYRFLRELRIGV